jgi:phage shock protein A
MASRPTDQTATKAVASKPKPELAPVEHKPANPNTEKAIEKLEKQIMELEQEIEQIENEMATVAASAKFDELKALESKRNAVQVKLEATTSEWELLIG